MEKADMETILAATVSSLIAGASAKAKGVASDAVVSAYGGLKNLIVQKLGNRGAVQSLEDDPDSDSARDVLIEALAQRLDADSELNAQLEHLETALAQIDSGGSDIDAVRGKVDAAVSRLQAAGLIKLGQ